MIPANELRINQWYIIENPMGPNTLEQFANWTQALDFESYGLPIPLTAETIVKLGFTLDHGHEYWNHYILPTGWHISQWVADKPMAGFEVKGSFYFGDGYLEITTVHDLQNLYFAHTKKELEFKP